MLLILQHKGLVPHFTVRQIVSLPTWLNAWESGFVPQVHLSASPVPCLTQLTSSSAICQFWILYSVCLSSASIPGTLAGNKQLQTGTQAEDLVEETYYPEGF